MSDELQVFKSSALQWIYHHNAYDKDEVKQIPDRYTNFSDAIIDCNNAISNSGLNGMSVHGVGPVQLDYIYAKPYDKDITAIKTKITNLNSFTSLIHEDCRYKVDTPFKDSMSDLKESVAMHSSFVVNCGEGFGELDINQIEGEDIRKWLESQMSMFDEESQFLTGDEDVDYYVKYYSQRQPGPNGKFNYEYALENWDNLNDDQKQALYHIYEYNVRICDADLTGESAEYKNAQAVVERMNQYLYTYQVVTDYDNPPDSFFNETSACIGMSEIAGKKEYSHSSEIFDDIINCVLGDVAVSDGNGGYVNTHVNEKGYNSDDPDVFKLTINADGAGMRLTFTYSFSDDHLQGVSESQDIGYYVPKTRAYAYVRNEEKKNPGCYDHMNKLGFNSDSIMSILMSADNAYDMDVFDNLTKGNGDYSQVFTHDVSNLSESGKTEITNYVLLLQNAYASTGDSRYANELNAVNSFYSDPGNEYAGGYYQDYFLRYYDIAKPNMSIDEKAEVWASPLYKMTDEEIEEARAFASEKLSEFQYGPNHIPLIKTEEEREKYELYVTLENKCSKVASTFTGVMTPIVSLVDFACDGVEWLVGTSAENKAKTFDYVFGTDTLSSVKEVREGYAQISDELMSDFKRDQANAAVQNKWYFAGGKLAGNALLYIATSPLFGEVAGAMGIKNAAGVFIVNQLGQNAQDLLLDTRVLYNDLVEDGNLSDKDVAELRNNILLNAGFNLAMGGAEEAIKAVRNASKADSLMNSFKTVDDQAAFIKSLNADDAALLAKRLGLENADDLMEQAVIAGKSFNSTPDMIKSVGESVDGVKLTGAAAEADDFFKGENFKAAGSFNDSIDAAKRATLVNNNAKCTSPLDSNLDGSLKANPGVVDPSDVKDLQNLRQTVSPVTPDTVMQKVIPQGTVDGLMDGGWNTVRGCTSKAVDAAPFTGTPEQAYRNLRLDYNGTPYKDIVDKGEDIYILRYTTDDVPKNVDYPKLDPKYGPPCTETGFLGGNDYLIPEYTHTSPAKITDGAIYKVSPDGTEKMVGYWDASKNGFRNAGEKVEKFNSWDEMKTAHKGTVTKYLKENKPKGSPTPKKWFDKGGTIEIIEKNSTTTWKYINAEGDAVNYVDEKVQFSQEQLFEDTNISNIDIKEFNGRSSDRSAVLKYIKKYGYDDIPEGYIVHHDYQNGKVQLVKEQIHIQFTHYGGVYSNK